jgi:hypothetical protein
MVGLSTVEAPADMGNLPAPRNRQCGVLDVGEATVQGGAVWRVFTGEPCGDCSRRSRVASVQGGAVRRLYKGEP